MRLWLGGIAKNAARYICIFSALNFLTPLIYFAQATQTLSDATGEIESRVQRKTRSPISTNASIVSLLIS
jgi:hypothetical protein